MCGLFYRTDSLAILATDSSRILVKCPRAYFIYHRCSMRGRIVGVEPASARPPWSSSGRVCATHRCGHHPGQDANGYCRPATVQRPSPSLTVRDTAFTIFVLLDSADRYAAPLYATTLCLRAGCSAIQFQSSERTLTPGTEAEEENRAPTGPKTVA